ncbi:MAG TPA: acylneuraminate cytidylyltransferase family protein, partial [Bryobacteraceae bacterium]|nr:acylneuraminate cytidylyltransferase family protein [Bryobacteraceae bacterium]
KPLIAYTIEAAQQSARLTRTIVSTEDPEIAATAERFGAEAPFVRPAELALDETPMLPVLIHGVGWLEDHGEKFDAVCLLQPTNPMRTASDIDGCIELMERNDADTVFTVLPVPQHYNPHWVYEPDSQGNLRLSTGESTPIPRRQQLPLAFHREGSVYVVKRNVLMEQNTLYGPRVYGYRMKAERSVNIDELSDWKRAATLVAGV